MIPSTKIREFNKAKSLRFLIKVLLGNSAARLSAIGGSSRSGDMVGGTS